MADDANEEEEAKVRVFDTLSETLTELDRIDVQFGRVRASVVFEEARIFALTPWAMEAAKVSL